MIALTVLSLVFGLWVWAAVTLDRIGGAAPPPGPYDAVVVAGAGVRPGGVPSSTLFRRTRHGARLVLEGQAPILALTGGIGDWGPAESEVAATLAQGFGVPLERIQMETVSQNTEGNARAIRSVLGDARVLVVTDRYHAWRCRRVYARYFSEVETTGVRGSMVPRTLGAMREVLAVAWYAVTGRLS